MTSDSTHRGVRLERTANSRYVATNDRGGQISIGTGAGTDFTPVDLFLAAIGGCTAVDVDLLTSRRAEPDAFEVLVDAEKIRERRRIRSFFLQEVDRDKVVLLGDGLDGTDWS